MRSKLLGKEDTLAQLIQCKREQYKRLMAFIAAVFHKALAGFSPGFLFPLHFALIDTVQ